MNAHNLVLIQLQMINVFVGMVIEWKDSNAFLKIQFPKIAQKAQHQILMDNVFQYALGIIIILINHTNVQLALLTLFGILLKENALALEGLIKLMDYAFQLAQHLQ